MSVARGKRALHKCDSRSPAGKLDRSPRRSPRDSRKGAKTIVPAKGERLIWLERATCPKSVRHDGGIACTGKIVTARSLMFPGSLRTASLPRDSRDSYLHAQAVDTTTPGGKALLQMAGVFAEFERGMIRERVLAGQARARGSGVRFGRPTIPADKAAAIVADLKTGVGVVKLAKVHSVGVGTVQKLKAKLAA